MHRITLNLYGEYFLKKEKKSIAKVLNWDIFKAHTLDGQSQTCKIYNIQVL